MEDDKVDEVNGISGQEVKRDSDSESESSEGDKEVIKQSKWFHFNKNFLDMALASKFPTICVNFLDKNPEDKLDVLECFIGKMLVEGNGSNKEIAKENADMYMFSLMENVLENEDTETINKYHLRQIFRRCNSWFSSVKKWMSL